MPSAGRTSIARMPVAPLMSTFDATLRVAGSMVTIDLPSTRPTIQPAAWAEVTTRDDATSAPVRVMVFLNIGVAPFEIGPVWVTAPGGTDGSSYGLTVMRMQGA